MYQLFSKQVGRNCLMISRIERQDGQRKRYTHKYKTETTQTVLNKEKAFSRLGFVFPMKKYALQIKNIEFPSAPIWIRSVRIITCMSEVALPSKIT